MHNHRKGKLEWVSVFSEGGIVPFQSFLLTEEYKKMRKLCTLPRHFLTTFIK